MKVIERLRIKGRSLARSSVLAMRRELDARHLRRLLLVYDTTWGDPLREEIAEHALTQYPIPFPSSKVRQAPLVLVHITSALAQEAFVTSSIRFAIGEALYPASFAQRPRSIVAWLLTDRTIEDVAQEIELRSRTLDSMDGAYEYHFWEPRVTQYMAHLYPDTEERSWITDSAWCFIDSFGRWRCLPEPDKETVFALPDEEQGERFKVADLAFRFLSKRGLRHGPEVIETLLASIDVGKQLGLSGIQDLARFVALRIHHQAPIENSALLNGLIASSRECGEPFQMLVKALGQNEWNAIVRECNL